LAEPVILTTITGPETMWAKVPTQVLPQPKKGEWEYTRGCGKVLHAEAHPRGIWGHVPPPPQKIFHI